MSRIKLSFPEKTLFQTTFPVRITDVNYGGHVGNDSILSILHEARMQWLKANQFTELDFAGVGMIMSDVAIEFKNELFYGDQLRISIAVGEVSRVSFELYYRIVKTSGTETEIVVARTGMVCYDYAKKKVAAIPEAALPALNA